MEQGKFRKRRKKFSQISNVAIQDESMSCQARFLYCLISSYISIPDFSLYKTFIKKKAGLGRDAFQKYWNELKTKGYLLQYELRDEKGHIYYEYELLDEPNQESEPQDSNSNNKEENKPDTDMTVYGLSGYGFSGYGESVPKNNIYNINNINNNNTNSNNKHNYKIENNSKIVAEFFRKAAVDDTDIDNETNKRLKNLLLELKQEEISYIDSLDIQGALTFYAAILNLYKDRKVNNKEGFLRSMLANIPSFVEKYKTVRSITETLEVYDSSKNREATKEEIEAFYKLRGGAEFISPSPVS